LVKKGSLSFKAKKITHALHAGYFIILARSLM